MTRRPGRRDGPAPRRPSPAPPREEAAGSPTQSGRRTVEVTVRGVITLGQLLKLCGAAGSGGQAKALLLSGVVTVNGEAEARRGRKLLAGDLVGLTDRVVLLVDAAEDLDMADSVDSAGKAGGVPARPDPD